MSTTILRLGWTNPQTGAFGAHPVLGPVLDLNDGVTFTLTTPDGLELPPPPRTLVTAGNIRTQGERATRAIYRHNRRAVARVLLGPMGSYADLAAALRVLVAWLDAAPSAPVTLMYQPANASQPVYLDVVGAAHTIPSDESQWLRLQFEPIEIVFIARPGLRGDRVTLQNLAVNPGFEAPSGPGVPVFADSFANANAYALIAGGAPTVAANVMTIPSGGWVVFGSPAWGAIQTWQFRFKWVTGLQGDAYVHFVDANNWLLVLFSGTQLVIQHDVAGTVTTVASVAWAPVNGTFYWLTVTQFPSVPGDPPYIQAALNADSAGAVGAQLVTCAGGAADGTVALTGRPQLRAIGAALAIGGAFAGTNVHAVSLFGPGGWLFQPIRGGASSTGVCSGAWEGQGQQSSANTYPGGPVTSFGSARVDLAPAGTVDTCWRVYASGVVAGSWLIPVAAAGDTLGLSLACKTLGLNAANGLVTLVVSEYDASGTLLRVGTPITQAPPVGWTTLSGSYVTGATCAYVDVCLRVVDTTVAGESANGTVWFDNVQVWDETATGESSMPYCELRFNQSPAQLLVSGLLGDLPAPAALALGTYLANWPLGGTLGFAVGRRASASATARLAATSHGWYSAGLSPIATAVLDANSYGGYYAQATVTSSWNPRAFSFAPADAPGVYHVLARFLTQQAAANLGNVEVRATMQQRLQPWYGALDSSDQLNIYFAPFVFPLSAANTWTVVDSGQVAVPAFNAGALTDPIQTYLTPRTQWADLTPGGSICQSNWQMLLPVDGSLLTGVLNNPTNAPFAVAGKWLWSYFDGLGTNLDIPAAWTYSLEAAALPNPAHASGGPGTTGSGSINVNSGADPYLTLDPQLQIAGAGGVNQLAAYVSDGSGAVLPFHADIQYTPLYLYPR